MGKNFSLFLKEYSIFFIVFIMMSRLVMVLLGKENYGKIRGKFEEKRKTSKFFKLYKYFFLLAQ